MQVLSRFCQVAVVLAIASVCGLAQAQTAADIEFFETKIRPILVEHCQACHGEQKQESSLRLDSRAGWEKGGDEGRAVVPGKPKDSLLIRMVQGTEGKPPQMPPETVLPASAIADLVKWVELGLLDPREAPPVKAERPIDWAAAEKFWSFQPLSATPPPESGDSRVQQPIDRFVAAGWKKNGFTPVERASKPMLLRRVTYGLTGLPPTAEDRQNFLADDSPQALAKVVDRLLASPQYGEWQGRAWLDVARYAEDQAQVKELVPEAWRYRDWVIAAFNQDLPYDKFVKYQLAADLLPPEEADYRHLPALGLLGLGTSYPRPNDLARLQADEWDDRLDTVTRGFLGLTVSCARCHDHKYDPIPTQDYYSLAGVIASTTKSTLLPVAPPEVIAKYDEAKAFAATKTAAAQVVLQEQSDRLAMTKTGELPRYALAAWKYQAKKLTTADLKYEDFAKEMGLDAKSLQGIDDYLRRDPGPDSPLAKWRSLLPKKDGPSEPPDEVTMLAEGLRERVAKNLNEPLNKRNLDLQKDLFSEKGAFAFTEAVIVASGSDAWKAEYEKFASAAREATAKIPPAPPQCQGVQEQPPDKIKDLKVYLRGNPSKQGPPAPRRFLRILAGEDAPKFTSGSGRLELAEAIASPRNPLTARVIVNRVWQQHFGRGIVRSASNFGVLGSRPTHPELLDYLAGQLTKQGWSLKRLHREIVLSETYQLASQTLPAQAAKDPENQWLWHMPRRRLTIEEFRDSTLAVTGELDRTPGGPSTELDDLANVRRTVYGRVSRYQLNGVLRLFDFPDPNLTSDRRNETVLPQQMLFLMNSPFIIQRAKTLAARAAEMDKPTEQVQRLFEHALGRAPNEGELALSVKFLAATDAAEEKDKNKLSRSERLAQSLLLSNEFYYVD